MPLNSPGKATTPSFLCDKEFNNSWMFKSLANGLGLQGATWQLKAKVDNDDKVFDTKLFELTVTQRVSQVFEPFKASSYLKDKICEGTHIIDIKALN